MQIFKIVSAMVLAAALAFGAGAAEADLRIEAESYSDYHNEGGYSVQIVSCGAASGGLAVEGLDRDGEWIEFGISLDEATCFVDSLRSAGLTGVYRSYETTFIPEAPGGSTSMDTATSPPGRGIT